MKEVSESERLLAEILRWTRELAMPVARMRLEGILDMETKRRVYDQLRSAGSLAALESDSGVNHKTIAGWLEEWKAAAIVTDERVPAPLFSLRELGIGQPAGKRARRG